jgi:pyroglutamyl-peptidase
MSSQGRKPRLLVTGFGPFPGIARNPSAEIARRVAASPRLRRRGAESAALILETNYAAIERDLAPAMRDGGFDAVLMIGVAGRSRHIRVERRALNRASILLPDATKRRPAFQLGAGPATRPSSVDPIGVWALLRRAGLACRVSQDAGRYLCNAAYFAALSRDAPVLFLHIPRAPRLRRRRPGKRIGRQPWEERLAAAFVEAGLGLLKDARRRRPRFSQANETLRMCDPNG